MRIRAALPPSLALPLTLLAGCYARPSVDPLDVRPAQLVAEGRMVAYAARDSTAAVDSDDVRFGITVRIHGRPVLMVADYGSSVSLLTDDVTDSLGLPRYFAKATKVDTLIRRPGYPPAIDSSANVVVSRGDTIVEYWGDFEDVVLDSLRLGTSLQDHLYLNSEWAADRIRPFQGILGRDVLSQFDVEFDVRGRAVRLYARHARDTSGSSPWLPPGVRGGHCAAASVRRFEGMDTTRMDEHDRAETRVNPGKRLWEATQLVPRVEANGHPFDAYYDSGSSGTLINWQLATRLGLSRTSPSVRADVDGPDTTFYATRVDLRIDGKALHREELMITDLFFVDYPGANTRPQMNLGFAAFRDRDLFLSYSTASICFGNPATP